MQKHNWTAICAVGISLMTILLSFGYGYGQLNARVDYLATEVKAQGVILADISRKLDIHLGISK